MAKAKGMAQIAARLGVGKKTARQLIQHRTFPVARRGEVHVVMAKHLDGYRADREAIPAWENEGGACRPDIERKQDHDHT